MEPPFHLFGVAHLTVIGLTIALPILLAAWYRRAVGIRAVGLGIRWSLAALLLLNWIGYEWMRALTGDLQWSHSLPMHLCDWASVTIIVALLSLSPLAYELSYFWGLAGTFQAILTPNLQVGFPSFRFVSFFIGHSGIVIGVLFLTLALKMRPKPGCILRVFICSQFYLFVALLVNWLAQANYGFLSHKPEGHSLLDYLADNRLIYILQMDALALIFFLILYLPIRISEFCDRRSNSSGTAP